MSPKLQAEGDTNSTPKMHPVVELIRERATTRSVPGARKDSAKLGLAIEGGGMRGVVSAGMVAALEILGLRNVFDAIYGSSAGAINGAYFVARQARYGTTIYYENINNKRFIDWYRFLSGQAMVSTDYLLDTVCVSEKPLNWEAVITSEIPLKIVSSSMKKYGKAVILKNITDQISLRTALRASSRIPMVAGDPVTIDDDEFLDASVFEAIPYRLALQDQCTHVLTLLTRPQGTKRKQPSLIAEMLTYRSLQKYDPEVAEKYRTRQSHYNDSVEFLTRKSQSDTIESQSILAIASAPHTKIISRTEKRTDLLIDGAIAGANGIFDCLGHSGIQLTASLSAYKDGCQFGAWKC